MTRRRLPFELVGQRMHRPYIWHNRCAAEVAVKRFLLLAGILFFVANLPSLAQSVQEPRRPVDGGTSEVLLSILIPSTPNAPFSATVNTEWIRQLADGATITLKNHRAIARDSAGRIFQERECLSPWTPKANHPLRRPKSVIPYPTISTSAFPRSSSVRWKCFPRRAFSTIQPL